MLTRESVISAWKANGWKDLTVTCPDGAEAVLSPCGTGPVIKTEADIEYVLVFCDIPYVGGALDYVINTLNDHAGRLAKLERERARLKEFFDAHIAGGDFSPDEWGTYSDWHKDLYGFRPHGLVCGTYVNPHR